MNSEVQWSLDMSNDDFVEASEKYFKRSFINLHIGCCLLAKVDPELKKVPVGKGYKQWDFEPEPEPGVYDYTRRPFLVALRALRGECPEHPLVPAVPLPKEIEDASDITLSTRTFVKWALSRWPHNTDFLREAEDHYSMKKAKTPTAFLSNQKSATAKKWAAIQAEFRKLLEDYGEKAQKMSNRNLALELKKRLDGKLYSAKPETLRKRIAKWRTQFGSLG